MSIDAYQAAAMQPGVVQVRRRTQILQNVKRACVIARDAAQAAVHTPLLKTQHLPMKLIVFPEFFLQGWTGQAGLEDYVRDVLITIPGEETDRLSELCVELDVFICGGVLERDARWDDRFFNTSFVIDPSGDIILKYRKVNTALPYDLDTSPHDMLAMIYGEEWDKNILAKLFPVVQTEIGNLGAFVCMDGHFPEVTRALALNGAEILLRPTAMPEPLVSRGVWKAENQVRALENTAYVIAPTIGRIESDELPQTSWPGGAMITDYRGVVLSDANYPGEGYCHGIIHLEELRRQRMGDERNFLPLLRNELWEQLYSRPVYTANRYADGSPPGSHAELAERLPYDIIRGLISDGVFMRPKDYIDSSTHSG